MLQYLQKPKLAYVFGSSLFVHGSLSVQNIGTVPGKKNIEMSLQSWVKELNVWTQKEVKDFTQIPILAKMPVVGKVVA
jgi:predicted component of type VI protein secretion system